MRAHLQGDLENNNFAQQLLLLGDGKLPCDPITNNISFPSGFCNMMSSLQETIDKVFPNISTNFSNHQWLRERAILATTNEYVNNINLEIQDKLPGISTTYLSMDSVTDKEQAIY